MANLREFQEDPGITWAEIREALANNNSVKMESALYYVASFIVEGDDQDQLNEGDLRRAFANAFFFNGIAQDRRDKRNDAS